MSNNPSSRAVVRIQSSALIFVLLVLIIGALLLASNNIDPNAGKRAQFTVTPVDTTTPVDPFAVSQYVSWKSPDGFVQLEHPNTWQPQYSGTAPFVYSLVPANTGSGAISFQMTPTSRIRGVTSTMTPDQLVKQLFATQAQDLPPVTTKPVQIGSFVGTSAHYFQRSSDSSNNQPVVLEGELWIVALDPTHMLIAFALTNSGDWAKIQPIFEYVIGSLKIDSAGAIKAMDAAFPATPSATGAATAAPTQAATPAAKSGTAPANATAPATVASS